MNKSIQFLKKFFLVPIFYLFCILVVIIGTTNLVTEPSNDRVWNNDQKILPYAEINDNLVTIFNIRNFIYTSTTDFEERYYNKTFDINTLKNIWYVLEPFEGIPGSAHTFLSFEFENNQFLAISIEIRKEKGETFNPIKGAFNQYELTYVIADERDVIKLRSNYRKDDVYVYPVKSTKEGSKKLFLDMIARANTLREHPEFYNTLTSNCTTNIVKHINKISPKSVPFFTLQAIFPKHSDKIAYKLGLLNTNLSFEDARARHYINNKASKYADDENFSIKIREE
jgi:hypothetical protein